MGGGGFEGVTTPAPQKILIIHVQCWLADDASCGGKVKDILMLRLLLKTVGPKFGYFPKATKYWLIVKQDKFEEAKSAFDRTDI